MIICVFQAEVEEKLMNFALEWMTDMKAALYKPEYIYSLLPRLVSTENRCLLYSTCTPALAVSLSTNKSTPSSDLI